MSLLTDPQRGPSRLTCWLAWQARVLLRRSLLGAELLMAYRFLLATPDTTLYQLAQHAFRAEFWYGAVGAALLYSLVQAAWHGLRHGPLQGQMRGVGSAAAARGETQVARVLDFPWPHGQAAKGGSDAC